MEAYELLEMLHEHGITGPVSRATLPGIFLSGLSPELHARVHKELMGKVDFNQATRPTGWESELLRIYVEQATLEERKNPNRLKATGDESPCPLALLTEYLHEPDLEQCNALPTTALPILLEPNMTSQINPEKGISTPLKLQTGLQLFPSSKVLLMTQNPALLLPSLRVEVTVTRSVVARDDTDDVTDYAPNTAVGDTVAVVLEGD
ncbi:hypothetical protein CYMTET_42383 [Cymbomonas tetramitiformis]|uniref:Uncharacterized protein n=1 Tax=Cymbomonas tetramitiformis TaxID=36881 RepID=A0AAE0F2P1_9CHLO|nr:hypothetical protein CYMTET_42383 [Cymbomonas tetramitiformis]